MDAILHLAFLADKSWTPPSLVVTQFVLRKTKGGHVKGTKRLGMAPLVRHIYGKYNPKFSMQGMEIQRSTSLDKPPVGIRNEVMGTLPKSFALLEVVRWLILCWSGSMKQLLPCVCLVDHIYFAATWCTPLGESVKYGW